MELNDILKQRNRLEVDAHNQIQESLNRMRADLGKTNEDVAKQLQEVAEQEKEKEEEADTPAPQQPQPQSPPQQPQSPPIASQTQVAKPLIYFSYPMMGYTEQPAWIDPLRQVLVANGYLIYNPWDKVAEQFGKQDLPPLNALPLKLVKALCSILFIPEEVLLPFDTVWKIIERGDAGDNFSIVFQCLWFLTRSSLVICDLMRPMVGAGTAQEMLYSRQLGIPVIGLLPTSGQLNPFAHRSTTALFSGTDLLSLLPIIKGYTL